MIRPYSGEYLVSPVPLHGMLAPCGYGCFYCFAKLPAKPAGSPVQIVEAVLKAKKEPVGKNMVRFFLSKGFPVLVSNTTDPFAPNNAETFPKLSKALLDIGQRVVVQTRGGKGFQEWAKEYPATMVYMSFTSDRDEITKSAEGNCPAFTERLAFAAAAKRAGHHVVAGINPYSPGWWKDFRGSMQKLVDIGISHVWFGEPHISSVQKEMIPDRQIEAHSEFVSLATRKTAGFSPQGVAARDFLHEMGFNTFTGGISSRLNFWKPYFDLGFPFFPTLDGWISEIYEGSPVAFSFDAFDRWAGKPWGSFGCSQIKQYLSGMGRTLRNQGKSDHASTPREIHSVFWGVLDCPSVFRCDDIYFVQGKDADGEYIRAHGGRDLLAYAPGLPESLTISESQIKKEVL